MKFCFIIVVLFCCFIVLFKVLFISFRSVSELLVYSLSLFFLSKIFFPFIKNINSLTFHELTFGSLDDCRVCYSLELSLYLTTYLSFKFSNVRTTERC